MRKVFSDADCILKQGSVRQEKHASLKAYRYRHRKSMEIGWEFLRDRWETGGIDKEWEKQKQLTIDWKWRGVRNNEVWIYIYMVFFLVEIPT